MPLLAPGQRRSASLTPDEAQNVITAAVSQMLADPKFQKQVDLNELPKDRTPSQMARWHDDNGPGFVRYYFNTRADFISLAPLLPQEYIDGSWVWTENPSALKVAEEIQGPQGESLSEIQWQMGRELAMVGQVGLAGRNSANGIIWHVLASDKGSYFTIKDPGAGGDRSRGWFAWPARPDLTKPPAPADIAALMAEQHPGDWLIFPITDSSGREGVHKIYRGQPRFWGTPVDPMSHVIRDIRRFENASRALHRATVSQLVNAGLMWFKGTRNDAIELAQGLIAGEARALGFLAQQIMVFIKAAERSINDYLDSDQLAVAPYPFISEEAPQPVEVGRMIDPLLIDAKRDALDDIARGLDIPQSWITEGPGAGHRLLNQWRQEASAKEGVVPEARMIGSALTKLVYRPTLELLAKERPGALHNASPVQFRLWPDESGLKPQEPPDANAVLQAWDRGLVSDDGVVSVIQMEGFEAPLPDGVSSFERWQMSTGNRQTASALADWFRPL